jgi:hypothetical protein
MTELRLRKQVLEWREVDGEVIALEHRRSAYLAANRAGALLWRALDAGATESQLVELLVAEYGIDARAAADDVGHFVAQLREQELLEDS